MVCAYFIEGKSAMGPAASQAGEGQLVLFADDGDAVILRGPAAGDKPVEILLLAGAPLGEPIARYGPFVMNTFEEIRQAIDDYQTGKMGRIENSEHP